MKKLFMLAVLMLLPTMLLHAATVKFEFNAKSALAYIGSTYVQVPTLEMDPSLSSENVTYSGPAGDDRPFIVDPKTGEVTLLQPNQGNNIIATYKYPNSSQTLTAKYQLVVIDPGLGQYRKVTDISELESGDNDYMMVNRVNNNNKQFYFLRYTGNASNLASGQANILTDYLALDDRNIIYPHVITNPPYKLILNDLGSAYSLECADLTNPEVHKYIAYPTSGSDLILSDDPKEITIKSNDAGTDIIMAFVETSNKVIGASKNKFQNITTVTPTFGLYKHYGFDAPEGPKVMIGDAEITDTAYNITGTSENVAIVAPNENVTVYYNWRPTTSSENGIVKVSPEVNKWTKYTEPIQLSEAGTLEYYSEQYGMQSEHKTLTITKQSTPTSVTEMTVSDDTNAIYYTLDGQKLSGKPNTAGVYVVLKDNKHKTLIIK